MNKLGKHIAAVGMLFAGAASAFGQEVSTGPLQDTERAAQYFNDELSFTTNPFGVKSAVEEKNPTIVIVDLRAAKDYKKGHIPGAINLPYNEYDSFEGPHTEFPGLSKDKFAYVYCYELLCNLGAKAAKKFASLGFPVKEMKGGFKAWQDHKYPVER